MQAENTAVNNRINSGSVNRTRNMIVAGMLSAVAFIKDKEALGYKIN